MRDWSFGGVAQVWIAGVVPQAALIRKHARFSRRKNGEKFCCDQQCSFEIAIA